MVADWYRPHAKGAAGEEIAVVINTRQRIKYPHAVGAVDHDKTTASMPVGARFRKLRIRVGEQARYIEIGPHSCTIIRRLSHRPRIFEAEKSALRS